MRILMGQVAMSLAVLAFAAVALRVGGALPAHARRFAFAWRFTGWAFLVEGSNSLFHDVFSIVAYRGGPESAAWAAVLAWHPILNHSRTFLLTAYAVVLGVALVRAARMRTPPSLGRGLALVVAGMLVGGVVGWREAAFSGWTHFSAVAVFDIMELLAFMFLIAAGLTTGLMDRALWFAISLNGFILALSVLLFAALSQVDLATQWSPSPLHVQGAKAFLHSLMVVIAAVYLRRVRAGRPIRGLVDAPARPAAVGLA
jgi:hypothetical protein